MSDELNAKIAKCSVAIRDYIRRLEIAKEPLVEDAAKHRQTADRERSKAARYQNANAALMELLGKAAQQGLDWAKTVVDVLDSYEIFKETPQRERETS